LIAIVLLFMLVEQRDDQPCVGLYEMIRHQPTVIGAVFFKH